VADRINIQRWNPGGPPLGDGKLWDVGVGGMYIYFHLEAGTNIHNLTIERATNQSGCEWPYWQTNMDTMNFQLNTNYYIQLAINMPSDPAATAANNVSIYVGTGSSKPVQQSITFEQGNCLGGGWYNLSGNACIGNYSGGLGGTLVVFIFIHIVKITQCLT